MLHMRRHTHMQESLAYVAYDAKEEQRLAEETTVLMRTYALPDGRVISLGQVSPSHPALASSLFFAAAAAHPYGLVGRRTLLGLECWRTFSRLAYI